MKSLVVSALTVLLCLTGCGGGSDVLREDGNVSSALSDTNLLKTGQTKMYVEGDDGYYQKGISRSYSRDDAKRIVIDRVTNLMWQDDANATVTKTFQEAVDFCQNLELGGFSDWKLPNIYELVSLVEYGKLRPSIDAVFQHIANKNYWSATHSARNLAKVKFVSFETGIVSVVSETYDSYGGLHFKCVRNAGEER